MINDGQWLKCYKCKTDMWLPGGLHSAALHARGELAFYCAYGHRQYYVEGESDETKLRRERDLLKQQAARLEDEARQARLTKDIAERETAAARKKLAGLKKRAATGTCPCCNRNFSELQKHIATKHPTFRAEDAGHEDIVSLVKLRGKPFPKSERTAKHTPKPPLAPRQIYQEGS